MEDEDVPPLEDLTEAVQRAKALRAHEPRMRSSNSGPKIGVAGSETVPQKLGESAETKEAEGNTSQSFGGFSKGFLLSTPKTSEAKLPSTKSSKKQTKTSSLPDSDLHTSGRTTAKTDISTECDVDIPFIKPQAAKGPVFPEVQEAMKEAYPLLNTQEWLTESLLEKIEKHPLLSKALQDPNLARAMSQFQSNPQAVLQSAAGNPELQAFLKEFCALMGEHFSELADKDDAKKSSQASEAVPIDEEVQRALSQKGVKEALSDPHIQQLISFLREDPMKAQRMIASASTDLQRKVQLLIDNGLLALQ